MLKILIIASEFLLQLALSDNYTKIPDHAILKLLGSAQQEGRHATRSQLQTAHSRFIRCCFHSCEDCKLWAKSRDLVKVFFVYQNQKHTLTEAAFDCQPSPLWRSPSPS